LDFKNKLLKNTINNIENYNKFTNNGKSFRLFKF
jgi:hypothetical protein